MKYKILADSSCDITDDMKRAMDATLIPLTMEVDGIRYVDDEHLDVSDYIAKMNASPVSPKSSCPSPDDYMNEMNVEAEGVFVVTLSSELSGSYNSAKLGADLFLEDHPDKKVHVFDSRSACAGEAAIALKLQECIESGMAFEEIETTVEAYITEMKTIFILEKLDHLEKAGRLSLLKATIANVLNIKLILTATDEGTIKMMDKARGTKKALSRMVELIGEVGKVSSDKILVIAQCNALDRANEVKELVQKTYNFKDVLIVATRGLSSNYANVGGIVLAY